MKTVEITETGLPNFETEWQTKVETGRKSDIGGRDWASERLHQMLQSSIWENTWRGFQGYDSPLAG